MTQIDRPRPLDNILRPSPIHNNLILETARFTKNKQIYQIREIIITTVGVPVGSVDFIVIEPGFSVS